MRMSDLFGRRHRERSADAESVSHDLLVRAGWVRRHASGIYTFLTPALKALRRIEAIVREEMVRAGAQEILMPVVQSADAWKATGRYASIDDTLVRFRDRRGHDMVLGMTHEEIVAELAASEIASYRDAGVVVFQIQTKFRDEARPRAGLLRTREFLMKDAYSIHVDREGMEAAYADQAAAYRRIFGRVGLDDVREVRSGSGDMGGDVAHEFMALLDAGEDSVALCAACGTGANVEVASDRCPECGGELAVRRAVEVGNIFQLGTRYADALGARAVDRDGRQRSLWMGSYGIGVSRLLATLVEACHDERGIALPAAVNAFDVQVIGIGDARAGAVEMAGGLERRGMDVLVEDRAVRAGEAFADADLLGATVRIVVGGRSGPADTVEVRERRTGHVRHVNEEEASSVVAASIADLRSAG